MTEYNGWENYETWRVYLELTSNKYRTYREYCGYMDSLIQQNLNLKAMAERLEIWVCSWYPFNQIYLNPYDNGLAYDILQRFFLSVNWETIVQHYLDEKGYEDDYKNGK